MRLLAEVTFSSNTEECLRMVSYNNIICNVLEHLLKCQKPTQMLINASAYV